METKVYAPGGILEQSSPGSSSRVALGSSSFRCEDVAPFSFSKQACTVPTSAASPYKSLTHQSLGPGRTSYVHCHLGTGACCFVTIDFGDVWIWQSPPDYNMSMVWGPDTKNIKEQIQSAHSHVESGSPFNLHTLHPVHILPTPWKQPER